MKEVELATELEIEKKKKESFLDGFEERYKEKFLPKSFTEEQKQRVLELTDRENTKVTMMTAIPMVCKAEACEFKKICPLYAENLAPRGERCPIELRMLQHVQGDLMKDLDVDQNSYTEFAMIRDMANQQIQMWRINNVLAFDSFMQENVVGVDQDGEPIMKKELHLGTDYEDKVHKRNNMLRKEMMANREQRAKAGLQALDASTTVANLVDSYAKTVAERNKQIKRDMGIIEKDAYIEAKLARQNKQEDEDSGE